MVNNRDLVNTSELTEAAAIDAWSAIMAEIAGESPKIVSSNGPEDLRARLWNRNFVVEFKIASTASAVSNAIEVLKHAESAHDTEEIPLLVVPFMTESARTRCREAGVSWLDLSGNADIKARELFVQIEGKPNLFRAPRRASNPFAPKSSRIIRTLLDHPRQRFFQKDLVDQTNVSKGLVSRVVKDLENNGYVQRRQDESVEIIDPGLLMDEWLSHYSINDHKITKGHIYSRGQGPELVRSLASKLEHTQISYAFTGLSAAWHYAPFSSFRLVALLVSDPISIINSDDFQIALEPRGANIWLIEPNDVSVFWHSISYENVQFASPLQTYLDLKDHPERANEAMGEIRKTLSREW